MLNNEKYKILALLVLNMEKFMEANAKMISIS